jgi:GT2 family glycosyltransferase
MITVVFSTRKKDENYIKSVKKAFGLNNLEILCYENDNQFSLTEIYNKGLKESKNNIVVFCHDDLIFDNDTIGKKIIKHFKETEYGILGIAGTTDLTKNGVWWSVKQRMVGQVGHRNQEKKWVNRYTSSNFENPLNVCVVDGLFFAVSKERIKSEFNEEYKGFHFYDITFCVDNYLNGVKIGVVSNIKITHKSVGETNEEWENNRTKFANEYDSKLPLQVPGELYYDNKPVFLKKQPKLAIIIPTKNKSELLIPLLESIKNINTYENYGIFILDTGSDENEYEKIKTYVNSNEKCEIANFSFYNFAMINNDFVFKYLPDDYELLLFCNNDILLLNDAISRLISTLIANYNSVGTVGCRLHYGNNSIQHSGIEFLYNTSNNQIHITHKGIGSYYDYYNHLKTTGFIGNTGAFMMIRKDLFKQLGGFNESYHDCLEDVELNMMCLTEGKTNIFVGDAVCYHYESQTRDNSKGNINPIDLDRVMTYLNKNREMIKKHLTYIQQ